jgi:hypothetical protein
MQITVTEIEDYLKVDSGDSSVPKLLPAAISFCETKLNRPILDSNMTDENRWTVPEDIRIAVYLLVSHWYENRIPVSQVTQEMAFSIDSILGPYRFMNV